jgi:heme iron utilization protein
MTDDSPARTARSLLRRCDRAALGTSLDGWPYVSLVLVAADHDGSPLLLLSDLAQHSRNLKRDPRVSLLFDGTGDAADPLTGARVSVLGEIASEDDPRLLDRYVARHPSAAQYRGFGDFRFYRVAATRAHLVAGFGRIDWIAADALLFDTAGSAALAAAEADILAHMNADHGDALDLYAQKLLHRAGDGWRMIGIDPEGLDLRRNGAVARLDFPVPVADAPAARAALVSLTRLARGG